MIVVGQDGHWFGSPRDLADLGWPVTIADSGFPVGLDECLCGIDVEAILTRHGIPFHPEAGGGFLVLGDEP